MLGVLRQYLLTTCQHQANVRVYSDPRSFLELSRVGIVNLTLRNTMIPLTLASCLLNHGLATSYFGGNFVWIYF